MLGGDRFHTMQNVSFGGVPAAQFWCDFILWEAILNENLETKAIVEYGTWQGGFSLYLASQARVRGIEFHTYDVRPPDREIPGFVLVDVWAEADRLRAAQALVEPVILFCDGGNKPRELREFALALTDPRSLAVVHDWGTETLPDDVPAGLVEVYGGFCDDLGSLSRVFRKET